MKIVDLGGKSDCSEPESKSEDESHPSTYIEPKISVPEDIKEKGGVETESSVQPPMKNKCDVDIVEQVSLVQQEIKEKQDVEPEPSVQQVQDIKVKGDVEQESSVQQVIEEKQDVEPESAVWQEIKERHDVEEVMC